MSGTEFGNKKNTIDDTAVLFFFWESHFRLCFIIDNAVLTREINARAVHVS